MLPEKRKISGERDPGLLIIYGAPKCGKTNLANTLDNNLILDLENGTRFLNSLSVNIIGIKPPEKESKESVDRRKGDKVEDKNKKYYLTEVGTEIITKGIKYDFVTLDTVSEFEEMLKDIALENYKNSPIGKNFDGDDILTLPSGGGYYWIREAYKTYIDKIRKLSPRIILIGHMKDKIVNKAGKEVVAKDLDLVGKLSTIACASADAIAYVYRGTDSELRMSFKTSEELNCGSRCNHLKGKDIKIAGYNKETNSLDNIDWGLIYPDFFNK